MVSRGIIPFEENIAAVGTTSNNTLCVGFRLSKVLFYPNKKRRGPIKALDLKMVFRWFLMIELGL